MTRVDFYLVPQATPFARHEFACKLIQKTFRLGHRIYVHCPDEKTAEEFDENLWQFQAQSFLPHELVKSPQQTGEDICIGWQQPPECHHDLLINLGHEIAPFFSRFQRVSEIVNSDEQVLARGRQNFKMYRHKNYPLHWHDLRR